MIELFSGIFVGNERDYYSIQHQANWAVLHCCKNPFHCTFVGYRGKLSPSHPDYAFKRKDNEMALNLVDMNQFSSNYLDFNRKMFKSAFEFLDEYRNKKCQILIHCNQGESRAPTFGMLYVARLGAFGYTDFDTSVQRMQAIYSGYTPKQNINMTVKSLWRDFVPNLETQEVK